MTTSVGERAIHPVVRVFREHKQGIFSLFGKGPKALWFGNFIGV